MKRTKAAQLWTLLSSMLLISSCTFGGGFLIVTFMKRKFVDELHWLELDEMLDMTALAQTAPGAIAVNAAILVGRRVAGWAGMAAAVIGTILPPMVILSVVSLCYSAVANNPAVAAVLEGMQAGVAAVIVDVVIRLGGNVLRERDAMSLTLMIAASAAVTVWHANVVLVVIAAALAGGARALWERRRRA
ncbi:MAG: chromate transporter [Eubacteriales bacterium]|nr:chromate transporter [Eubacteriales bacterium]